MADYRLKAVDALTRYNVRLMRTASLAMLLAAMAAHAQSVDGGLAATPDIKPRLFVSDLTAQGVPAEQAAAFTQAVTSSLSSRQLFEVVSSRDVASLLAVERQKQLLGASCEGETCASSMGQALSARFVISGQLARLGTTYQLTLQMLDTVDSKPVGRATRLSSSLEELRQLVPYAAAEATGSPLPPPPSRVLPITLLSVGGAAIVSSGVLAVSTFSRQQALNDELCPGGVPLDGRCHGTELKDMAFYKAQDGVLTTQKWVAAGVGVAGLALVAVGLIVMPPADGRVKVAFVPTGSGVALTGVFE